MTVGFVIKTPAGTYRANWRDSADRQKAKTFRTKKEANAYLAEVEGALNKGTYVDPHAGRMRFGEFVTRWLAGRSVEARTAERTESMLRAHLLPQWADWPLGRIDYLAVQEWVTTLGRTLAPSTTAKHLGLLSMIMQTAIRARLIAVNPCDGVRVPRNRAREARPGTVSREAFLGRLLPAVPTEHRGIVCAAAGAGLRWGECAGLPWEAVDLDRGLLHVAQVAVETHGGTMLRAYPKSRAGVRAVPMPPFLVDELRRRRENGASPDGRALVFADRDGGPQRRSNFRRRVWLPSLVRAGLLGRVAEVAPGRWLAVWPDRDGREHRAEFTTEAAAVAHTAASAFGGLRFHDLRHSYITWLVTGGVPVNVVRRVVGHEKASTTLDRYTHTPEDYADRVRLTFADDSLTFRPSPRPVDLGDAASSGPEGERERDDPRRGETGVVSGSAPGGSSRTHSAVTGGCNRRGSAGCRRHERSSCRQSA
ncbi:tyrosine-type recombinase/integrase [Micromonospora sp. WMMA1363]|uniref:tyrosine-type recombinase/integrase n=1 Tax=Micromonospora sp. WMMA1363 TaxID=3053985 RepID=UPI00259CA024|nr:tyrosine-type recombinase/integrase [Micromonospora sp. WMMA1363]MDM4722115.1 tyrosine-type recombinase/integrase [Micromonospora sp. WMMA1363]